ncbi:hypothetical protein K402DRAFT_409716 [Aulographum hederae CBS 113979]|uniref:N-acetyltransferase domain-containing protein n=1 Tax=Aulographum hederae CBS 113979 TaxID=1176131 RepID=A0A6G1HEE7_9PEZI|nr:hypothetical protein K402DRAFT_409716 [Aulographum hederae CBS 113979]
MQQSSLSAWLNKPSSVKQPPNIPLSQVVKGPLLPKPQPQAIPEATPSIVRQPLLRHPLPPNVTVSSLTPTFLPAFKRLLALLLPIPYHDKFFDAIFTDPTVANITLVALWHKSASAAASYSQNTSPQGYNGTPAIPTLVSAVRCKILETTFPEPPNAKSKSSSNRAENGTTTAKPTLYISTLATLPAYQSHALASTLLQTLIARAVKEYDIGGVSAHVWEANTEAREWYRKRGFRECGLEEGYYRRLRPTGAVRIVREVGVRDLLGEGFGQEVEGVMVEQ